MDKGEFAHTRFHGKGCVGIYFEMYEEGKRGFDTSARHYLLRVATQVWVYLTLDLRRDPDVR